MNKIVQSLWIGEKLSLLEQLCIKSFLKNQHEYHLYVYGDVKNIPLGTTVLDGNEILPKESIFTYQQGIGKGSYSGFSNFFRYQLLLKKGGWWVDTDFVCLKPLDFTTEYVFASEYTVKFSIPTSGIIKAPKQSEFALYCWDSCQTHDITQLQWGVTGPRLIGKAVEEFQLKDYVNTPDTFCPLNYRNTPDLNLINPEYDLDVISKNCYTIHLWNEMWRRKGIGKDEKYHKNCLYEKLKSKYL